MFLWVTAFIFCFEGEYLKKFCNEHDQTVCSPCDEGYYSDNYTLFDRCEKCQSCQHGKTENNEKIFNLYVKNVILISWFPNNTCQWQWV